MVDRSDHTIPKVVTLDYEVREREFGIVTLEDRMRVLVFVWQGRARTSMDGLASYPHEFATCYAQRGHGLERLDMNGRT